MSSERERWIWGYKSSGLRPLTAQELEALRSDVKRLTRRRRFCLLCTIASVACILVGFGYTYDVEYAWGWPFLIGGLVGVVVFPLLQGDAGKKRRVILAEIRDGRAESFLLPDSDYLEEEDPDGVRAVTVYHGSGRALSFGDAEAERDVYFAPKSVAAPPTRRPASRAMPPRLAILKGSRKEAIRVRQLSSAENEELREIVQEISFRKVWWGPFVWLYVTAGFLAGALGPERGTAWGTVRMFLFGLLSLWMLWTLLRRLDSWTRLKRDARQAEAHAIPRTALGLDLVAEAVEILPHSEVIWTVDHEPALWRKEAFKG